jgi:hypothetical protein
MMVGMAQSTAPSWLADVTAWLVTLAEGRFGPCRMLLWLGDDLVSVVMPHPEYTLTDRSLDPQAWTSTQATLTALWEHGLLPTQRPDPDGVAPMLGDVSVSGDKPEHQRGDPRDLTWCFRAPSQPH